MGSSRHLMVGLPGVGKTTRAKMIEATTGALQLTPNEWHTRLFGDDLTDPDHERRNAAMEALMRDVAAAVLCGRAAT